jgi:hypothetical protein
MSIRDGAREGCHEATEGLVACAGRDEPVGASPQRGAESGTGVRGRARRSPDALLNQGLIAPAGSRSPSLASLATVVRSRWDGTEATS